MEIENLYLLIEALINQNIRSFEATYSFQVFSILAYYFLVTSTSYMIKKLNVIVRLFATSTAILFNLTLIYNLHIQLAVGNTLLNVLAKLALEDKARIFKENLMAQGVEPGKNLVILDPNLLEIYLLTLFLLGLIAPVYLYLFAKWNKS